MVEIIGVGKSWFDGFEDDEVRQATSYVFGGPASRSDWTFIDGGYCWRANRDPSLSANDR
jgi:hypothetical protein